MNRFKNRRAYSNALIRIVNGGVNLTKRMKKIAITFKTSLSTVRRDIDKLAMNLYIKYG